MRAVSLALFGLMVGADPMAAEAAAAPDPKDPSWTVDGCPQPSGLGPAVPLARQKTDRAGRTAGAALLGWSRALVDAPLVDRRRRPAPTPRPADFGATLGVGERFRFDLTFSGNPAGLAEAEIVALEPDPRGGPPHGAPVVRIAGHARTSGIVSLLATVTDEMVALVDARSGASVWSENVLVYGGGWSPVSYRKRVTTATYAGRGQVDVVDLRDEKRKDHRKVVPADTFDPLGLMAWVRAQRLQPGQRVIAHVIDGVTLMRVEIRGEAPGGLDPLPSMAKALGLGPNDVVRISGKMTRVDEYDQPVPDKRVFALRAWLSGDDRRIPLVMESDMWVGSLRLELQSYDPPRGTSSRPGDARGGARSRAAGGQP